MTLSELIGYVFVNVLSYIVSGPGFFFNMLVLSVYILFMGILFRLDRLAKALREDRIRGVCPNCRKGEVTCPN